MSLASLGTEISRFVYQTVIFSYFGLALLQKLKVLQLEECPPRGAARSSLVPRDLTAEPCLIALASLGLLLLGIRLTAFFISRCWVTFWALSFTVVFSVVGSLLTFPL